VKETIRSTRQFRAATLAGECGRGTGSGLRLEQEEAEDLPPLPPPDTKRWVARRKAAVVVAVRAGMITMDEALHRYQLREEEFLSWTRMFECHGHSGLRATFIQRCRVKRHPEVDPFRHVSEPQGSFCGY